MDAAISGRHAITKPPGLAELAHQRTTGFVHVRAMLAGQVRGAPGVELFGETAMVIVEEGPFEEGSVRHQSPSNSGVRFAAKAS